MAKTQEFIDKATELLGHEPSLEELVALADADSVSSTDEPVAPKATDAKKKDNDLDTEDNKGNPYHDNLGRFSEGGSGSGGWKPSGTSVEAKEFAKNSDLKKTLYHGTTPSSASKIEQNGFALNKKSNIGDTNFPGTICLTDSPTDASWYAHRAGKSGDGKVLALKINTKNYKSLSYKQFSKIEDEVAKKHNIHLNDKFGNLIDDPGDKNFRKLQGLTWSHVLNKYEVVKYDSLMGSASYHTKNPKTIMVIKDE